MRHGIDALGKPGTLVRSQAMEGAPLNAAAWRVLYRSTGFDGQADPGLRR